MDDPANDAPTTASRPGFGGPNPSAITLESSRSAIHTLPAPTIRVHAAEKTAPKHGPFLRVTGLGLVLIGVFFGSQTDSSWDRFIRPMPNHALTNGSGESSAAASSHATEPVLPEATATSAPSAETATGFSARMKSAYQETVSSLSDRWRWLLIGATCMALATACIGGGGRGFVISALYLTATAWVVAALLAQKLVDYFGSQPSLVTLITLATAGAYLIHAIGDVRRHRLSEIVGLALALSAGAGVVRGWFESSHVSDRLGAETTSTLQNWHSEISWGVVLLFTVIGVVTSRGRMMRCLHAVLLASLAYYCIRDGSLHVFTFGDAGWSPIAMRDLSHVETWRWVLVGELVLLSAVLLHLALGVGSLTVVFAVLWLGFSLHVDREVGRDTLLACSRAFAIAQSRDVPTSVDRGTGGGPADMLGVLGPRGAADESARPRYSAEQKAALMQKAQIRLAVVYGWIYVTALLAGVIAAAGLRMLFDDPRMRSWTLAGVWFLFGAAGYWLWGLWPSVQNWESTLAAFAIPRTHVYGIVVAMMGMTALCSAWSLRWNSSFTTWLHAAATVTFLGTALTLIGIAVLIKFTGHGQLPVWAYASIAGGQSSLMWVLLIHQSDRIRRGAS